MQPIKIRYTFKRKADGHLWQEIVPLECLEKAGDTPFIHWFDKDLWEVVWRDLFSGAIDKNWNDIFAWDIVHKKIESEHLEECDWGEEKWEVFFCEKNGEWRIKGAINPLFCFENTILGNIYDTPEPNKQ